MAGNLYPDIVEVIGGRKGDKGDTGPAALPLATVDQARAGIDNATTISPFLLSSVLSDYVNFVEIFTPLRLWGWAGPSYIVACCDIAGSPDDVSLVVATDSGLNNIVGESTPQPTITTSGYNTVQQAKVVGLSPNTVYFYGMRVNGVVKDSVVNSITTQPSPGTVASFRTAFGSCSKPSDSSRPDRVYRAIAARAPRFLLHLGDFDYSDVDYLDIKVQRSRNSRVMRSNRDFLLMSASIPTWHSFSDHDSAGNDNHWDALYNTGYYARDIITQTRLAIFETEPLPPLWQDGEPDKTKILIGRSVQMGRVKFIVPDWQSQKRHISADGRATLFGNGITPPGSYDQEGKLTAELDVAEADMNTKLVVFGVAPTWFNIPFDSIPKLQSIAQTELCDKFSNMDTMVTIQSGDCHETGIDNSVFGDYSSDGTMRVLHAVSSPLSNLDTFDNSGPFVYNGSVANIRYISSQFGEFEVTDNGGSDLNFAYRMFSAPFDPVTFAGTLNLSASTTDIAPGIGFEGRSTVIAALSQGVPVYKSFVGPVDGAVFNVASSAGTVPATGKVKPNRNIGWVPLTGLSAGATGVLTLSSPQRSSIVGAASVNFIVRDYLPETAMYLNELPVTPNATRQGVIDTFIRALVDAGVWNKFAMLHLHASNDAGDALINVRRPRGKRVRSVGSTTFVQDRYNTGAGTADGYFDTDYTGGIGFDHGQGFAFIDIANNVDRNTSPIGNGTLLLNPRASNAVRFRLQTSVTLTVPNTDGSGTFLIDRAGPTDPDGINVWRNSTLLGHVVEPPAGGDFLSAPTMWVGGWESAGDGLQYDNRQLRAWGLGRGGWTPTNVSDFNAALAAYRTAIGA